ncbi:MAG: hypothetical protein ACOC1K_01915 [Nanoarchaeota archaeon]
MSLLDSFKEEAKSKIRDYVGPAPKKNDSLELRREQKKDLERVSKLLGLRPVKSRKLSLTFDNSSTSNSDGTENKTNNFDNGNKLSADKDGFSQDNKNNTYIEDDFDEEKDEGGGFTFNNTYSNKRLDIEDVVKYFKEKGVVGEESLSVKIFLAASNNMSFGVEGYSGSGKTFVVDKLIDLYDCKDLYKLDLSSKMAVFYDSKNINGFKTIYIPELQKAMQDSKSPIIEVVKNLTEGKDVQRVVTDAKRKGNKTFKINSGKSIIYTLASENYFKKDEELNRRFLRFKTNNSESHLEDILNYKSDARQDFSLNNKNDVLKDDLKNHFNYLKQLDVKIFDPYSSSVLDFLPKTQKSVGYVDHYFSLVDAATKFNCNSRVSFEYDNNKFLVSDLEDHVLVHKLYYDEFLNTLKGFSERNKLDDEVDIINSIQNKTIDWSKIFNDGLKVVESKLGDLFEVYSNRLDLNTHVDDVCNKYSFIKS